MLVWVGIADSANHRRVPCSHRSAAAAQQAIEQLSLGQASVIPSSSVPPRTFDRAKCAGMLRGKGLQNKCAHSRMTLATTRATISLFTQERMCCG